MQRRTDDMGVQAARGMYHRVGHPPVDFDHFHRVVLPEKLRNGASERVHWDVAGAAPIAIQLDDGRAYSFRARDARVEVVPGVLADADPVVEMGEDAWIDYRYEMRTRIGPLRPWNLVSRVVTGPFWKRPSRSSQSPCSPAARITSDAART